MAYVDQNDIIAGLRGKFGKQFIFRRFGDRTIAVRKTNPVQPNSEKQLRHRERFRLATRYARRSFLIPEMKEHYIAIARLKKNTTPFGVAVGDFLASPAITNIITGNYHGRSGDRIDIMVNDIFKVRNMKVTISGGRGEILETGDATCDDGCAMFSYVTTFSTPSIAGVTVSVEVTDWPGNVVVAEAAVDRGK